MTEDVGVSELRLALAGQPRGVAIDQEQCWLGRVAVDERMHDDVVGLVAAGDEPFLPVDHVALAPTRGRRLDQAGVRAGIGLGDGHAGTAVSETTRYQVVADLLGAAVLQRHGRVPNHGPQRASGLAQLLVDQRLLHLRAALAADRRARG